MTKIYTHIKQFPFNLYEQLTVEDDLSVLVIEGEPDPLELLAAKESIQEQVSELLAGSDIEAYISDVWGIESISARVIRLKKMLLLFLQYPHQKFIDFFADEGFVYPTDDLNQYKECIANEIYSLESGLVERKTRFDKHNSDNEAFKATYQYYADIFAEIRKLEGWNVPKTISTLEYCNYYNRLRRHIERLKSENK